MNSSPVSTSLYNDEPLGMSTEAPGLPQRKKLELKPRSARAAERARRRSTSAKGDPFASPFGAARPREEVLKSRGVDAKAIDSKVEAKATKANFTKEQEAQIEEVRAEYTKAESRFRQANEMELPEEAFRVRMEEKRDKMHALIEKFTRLNAGDKPSGKGGLEWTTKTKSGSPRRQVASGRSRSPVNGFPATARGGTGNWRR